MKKIGLVFVAVFMAGCAGTPSTRLGHGGLVVAQKAVQVQEGVKIAQAEAAGQAGNWDQAEGLYQKTQLPPGVYHDRLGWQALAQGQWDQAVRQFDLANDPQGLEETAQALLALGFWNQGRMALLKAGNTQAQAGEKLAYAQVDRAPLVAIQGFMALGDLSGLAQAAGVLAMRIEAERKAGTVDEGEVEAYGGLFARLVAGGALDQGGKVWENLLTWGQGGRIAGAVAALGSDQVRTLARYFEKNQRWDPALDCALRSQDRTLVAEVCHQIEKSDWEHTKGAEKKNLENLLVRAGGALVGLDNREVTQLALRLARGGAFPGAEEVLMRAGMDAKARGNLLFVPAWEGKNAERAEYYARYGQDKGNLSRVSDLYETQGQWARALVFADLAKDSASFQRLGAKIGAYHGKNHKDYLIFVGDTVTREESFLLASLYTGWTSTEGQRWGQPAYWALVRSTLGPSFVDQQARKLKEMERAVTRMKLGLGPNADDKTVEAARGKADESMKKLLEGEQKIFAEAQRSAREVMQQS